MNHCGRCNATTQHAFCRACIAFFSRLTEPYPAESAQPLLRSPADLRRAATVQSLSGWREVVMVNRGLSVGLRANESKLLEEFFSCPVPLSDFSFAGAGDYRCCIDARAGTHGRSYVLSLGRQRIGVLNNRAGAVMCLLSHLHWKIVQSARANIFVHAGVVGWKGIALVLPGRSLIAKTSLVVELLRHGATYLSDEYAVFDSAGMVHPFVRKLDVRSANGVPRRMPAPAELAASTATARLPLGLLLFTSYSQDAEWQARRLTPGQALPGLLQNTVAARRAPAELLNSLKVAVQSAPAFAAKLGEADQAVRRILRLIEAERGLR